MAEETASHSWWQTLPGVITATGGLLTAISALVLALHQAGIFGKSDAGDKKEIVAQERPAGNVPTIARQDPENPGIKKPADQDVPADGASSVRWRIAEIARPGQVRGSLQRRGMKP